MKKQTGAMTIAEGNQDYKTDVSLTLCTHELVSKTHVLRTSFDILPVWTHKHDTIVKSPFEGRDGSIVKMAAIIDREVWVFEIDSTKSDDIVTAIKIAMKHYNVNAKDILSNIYVKNLNSESDNGIVNEALIKANKKLYSGVTEALINSARILGLTGQLELWVISNNKNPKINQQELHSALKDGGAESVITDDKIHKYTIGSNDGALAIPFTTNLHLATLKI